MVKLCNERLGFRYRTIKALSLPDKQAFFLNTEVNLG